MKTIERDAVKMAGHGFKDDDELATVARRLLDKYEFTAIESAYKSATWMARSQKGKKAFHLLATAVWLGLVDGYKPNKA